MQFQERSKPTYNSAASINPQRFTRFLQKLMLTLSLETNPSTLHFILKHLHRFRIFRFNHMTSFTHCLQPVRYRDTLAFVFRVVGNSGYTLLNVIQREEAAFYSRTDDR